MIGETLFGLKDLKLMALYEGSWKHCSLNIGWHLAL
jgi:hypothetical protein